MGFMYHIIERSGLIRDIFYFGKREKEVRKEELTLYIIQQQKEIERLKALEEAADGRNNSFITWK